MPFTPDLLALASDPGLRQPAVVTVNGWRLICANPVAQLRSLDDLDRYASAVGWRSGAAETPPFATAAIGYLSHDLSPELLALPPDHRPGFADLPPVHFGVYDWAVAIAPDGRACVIAVPERLDALCQWAAAAPTPPSPGPAGAGATARAGMDRATHRAAVQRIQEWIAAGDLYQANLTFQITVPWSAGAVPLAMALADATPSAAHAALLVVDEANAIISASPETFLRVAGDRITTRPVKGTRPRSPDPDRDRQAGEQLRASAKDHAEHVMIVDLERNDLGRVCVPGSVSVPDYAALEGHPTVWHLTSTVVGTLRDDVSLAEVLRATFPPGSVTGTPKRMAVARTALVEPVRRGVYCGAIGVVAPGVVDLSVAIRTAVLADGIASYGAGGAIVADSDADDEYDEALAKATAFLRAANASLPD